MRTIEEIAAVVAREIKVQTDHYVDTKEMHAVAGVDVWGPYRRVAFTSSPSKHARAEYNRWWDYDVIAPLDAEGNAIGTWRLEARAPHVEYPGWGRREVVQGKLVDTDEDITRHIRLANGPLECLTMEARKRRGQ